jgi:hypothetical protein
MATNLGILLAILSPLKNKSIQNQRIISCLKNIQNKKKKSNRVDPNPILKTPQTQAIHQTIHLQIPAPAQEKIEKEKNLEAILQKTKNKKNDRKKNEAKMTEKTKMIKAKTKIKAKEVKAVIKVNKESRKTEMKREDHLKKRSLKNIPIKMTNMENNNQKTEKKDKKEAVREVKKDSMKETSMIQNIKKIKTEKKIIKLKIKSKTIRTIKEAEVNRLTDSI